MSDAPAPPILTGFLAVVVLLAAAVALIAAAAQADIAAARARWDAHGPKDYRFVWSTHAMVGTTRTVVEVRDRQVVAGVALERDAAGRDGGPRPVEDVFALVAQQSQSTADHVQVAYHPELGYPTDTEVDITLAAIDDEHGFAITNLEPL